MTAPAFAPVPSLAAPELPSASRLGLARTRVELTTSSSASATRWSSSSPTRDHAGDLRHGLREDRQGGAADGPAESRSRSTSSPAWSPRASCSRASSPSRSPSPSSATRARLKRLRATPMPPSAYFLGKIGQVLWSPRRPGGSAARDRRRGVRRRPADRSRPPGRPSRGCSSSVPRPARSAASPSRSSRAPARRRARSSPRSSWCSSSSPACSSSSGPPDVDAAGRRGLPAQVDGSGHAVGLPPPDAGRTGRRRAPGSTARPRSCSRVVGPGARGRGSGPSAGGAAMTADAGVERLLAGRPSGSEARVARTWTPGPPLGCWQPGLLRPRRRSPPAPWSQRIALSALGAGVPRTFLVALVALAALVLVYWSVGRRAVDEEELGLGYAYLAVLFAVTALVTGLNPMGTVLLFVAYSQVWLLAPTTRAGAWLCAVLTTLVTLSLLFRLRDPGESPAVIAFQMLLGFTFSILMGVWLRTIIRAERGAVPAPARAPGCAGRAGATHHSAGVMAERERIVPRDPRHARPGLHERGHARADRCRGPAPGAHRRSANVWSSSSARPARTSPRPARWWPRSRRRRSTMSSLTRLSTGWPAAFSQDRPETGSRPRTMPRRRCRRGRTWSSCAPRRSRCRTCVGTPRAPCVVLGPAAARRQRQDDGACGPTRCSPGHPRGLRSPRRCGSARARPLTVDDGRMDHLRTASGRAGRVTGSAGSGGPFDHDPFGSTTPSRAGDPSGARPGRARRHE